MTDEERRQLEAVCERVTPIMDQGKPYVLLSNLRLPDGCTPANCDALLCLADRDGYPSRLFLSERIKSNTERNWNSLNVTILERNWHAYSWTGVPVGRPVEMLAQHLMALR